MDLFIQIYNDIDVFSLVFIRIIGFMAITPVFSGKTIPTITRIGFAVCFALLTLLSGAVETPVYAYSIPGFVMAMLSEFMTGFLIGFVVYMTFTVLYMMGQLADYQLGFSMVSVYDPVSQIQAPITGNLFYFMFLAIFIVSGGLNQVMYFLFNSYTLIPPGSAFIVGNNGLAGHIVGLMTDYLELGVKFSMPIIAAIIVIDVALGLLVKAVPQMNVFVVGMPLKVGAGLLIIYVMVPIIENLMYDPFYEQLIENVYITIKGLAL